MAETNLRIVSKHLGVSPESDAIIHEHIAAFSEQFYLLGGENSVYWLQQRWHQKRDLRGLALLTLARLGVPAQRVAQAYGLIKRTKSIETTTG
jgi:hypothetical protein